MSEYKNDSVNKRKGIAAEIIFEIYLNDEKIPFLRIDQSEGMISSFFYQEKDKKIKRPDYIILSVNNTNDIYIDVKYRNKNSSSKKDEPRFYIDADDVIHLYNFHEKFKKELWVVFIDFLDNNKFYYIDITKLKEIKKEINNNSVNIDDSLLQELLPDVLNSRKEEKSVSEDINIDNEAK